MHKINYLHLPDLEHPLPIRPIRLELVKRLQRLVPEMGAATTDVTDDNSTKTLTEITSIMDRRASDELNHYADVHIKREEARRYDDRHPGFVWVADDPSDAESTPSDAESTSSYDRDAPGADASIETWSAYWRTLARA